MFSVTTCFPILHKFHVFSTYSLADELLSRGFNVLVHGRSPTKLSATVDKLRQKHPNRAVESVQADFDKISDLPNIPAAMHGKNVTLFVNNVAPMDQVKDDYILVGDDKNPKGREKRQMMVNVMVTFTTALIDAVIPLLRDTADGGPSIMVNVGSAAGKNPVPYIAVYGASKAYLMVSCTFPVFKGVLKHYQCAST